MCCKVDGLYGFVFGEMLWKKCENMMKKHKK